MSQDVQIEQVPAAARGEALRFLVAGRRRDVGAHVQAEAFERMIAGCGGLFELWQARRGERCQAVALVVASAGRTGMLFHSAAGEVGRAPEGLADVVVGACAAALDRGLSFVQSLVEPSAAADVELLASAGFCPLAELVYMKRSLRGRLAGVGREGDWTWRDAEQFDEAELAYVIKGTYEDSLDCPALRGVRGLADVIRGHKASGLYNPRSWWLALEAGRPAGCILVNDSAGYAHQMELVYMGVVKGFRGRGLGRTMVARAARWAQQQGCGSMSVAVDAANPYAKRIYDELDFRQTDRRLAYMLARRARR